MSELLPIVTVLLVGTVGTLGWYWDRRQHTKWTQVCRYLERVNKRLAKLECK